MPKKQKSDDSASSDSDSGPEDRNQPPPKKSKASNAAGSKTTAKDSNQTQWTLEKLRQVNINEFRGRKTVDIREFYEKDGKVLPGKKGISLTLSQWKTLLSYAEEITAAIEA